MQATQPPQSGSKGQVMIPRAFFLIRFFCSSILALLAFFIDATASQSFGGGCLNDTRRVQLDKRNVAKLSDYFCRRDSEPETRIRVQFQRLRGLAPGVVLNGGSAPWVRSLYGTYRVIPNDVLKEYRNLISRFGAPIQRREGDDDGGMELSMKVDSLRNSATSKELRASKGAKIHSYELTPLPSFSLVDETVHMLEKPTFPSTLNMTYIELPQDQEANRTSLINGTIVWRYLTRSDLDNYTINLQKYNTLVTDRAYRNRPEPKAIQLLRYITASGWPAHFLYASGYLGKDWVCESLDFVTSNYSLEVDIATVENVSQRKITIDRLFGAKESRAELRAVTDSSIQSNAEEELLATRLELEPRETLIVPLRLLFTPTSDSWDRTTTALHYSELAFARIQNAPRGTIFSVDADSLLQRKNDRKRVGLVIRKSRESFKAPSYPTIGDYVFGIAWALNGIDIGGEKIAFRTAIPNFVEITAAVPAGSCPILYVWGDDDHDWIRLGKIIHKAQGSGKMLSETIELSGLAYQFRINEEELERAVIDSARLEVILADGRSLELLPMQSQLRTVDGSVLELFAGDDIYINFFLRADFVPSQVIRSRLTITGYYERYPGLLVSRQRAQ